MDGTLTFEDALKQLIDDAIEDPEGPDLVEVVFDLGQAELRLRLAMEQAAIDAAAEEEDSAE